MAAKSYKAMLKRWKSEKHENDTFTVLKLNGNMPHVELPDGSYASAGDIISYQQCVYLGQRADLTINP